MIDGMGWAREHGMGKQQAAAGAVEQGEVSQRTTNGHLITALS